MIESTLTQLERVLWDPRIEAVGGPVHFAVRVLRYPFALMRDAASGEGQLTLRAMSLVYTTLLSLVPLLAFSFSILKAFDFHTRIKPLLQKFLEPLGENKAAELTEQIWGYVDKVSGTVLGSVGLLVLVYTVVSMVQKVEESFNYVWQVERPRSLGRRFSEYLTVILIGPILIVFALGITASIANSTLVKELEAIEPFGTTIVFMGKVTPYAVVIFVFSFLYAFVPNTPVRLKSALVGGVTGGVLWASAGVIFARFVVASTKYVAIYSAFGIVLVALIWLYLNWLILLLGSQIAFYHQHPEYLRSGRRRVHLQNAAREHIALMVMFLIGKDYRQPGKRWKLKTLATHLNVPRNVLETVVRDLERHGLLVATESEQLIPGRDTDCIPIAEILQATRYKKDPAELDLFVSVRSVLEVTREAEKAVAAQFKHKTLKSLVEEKPVADPDITTPTPRPHKEAS